MKPKLKFIYEAINAFWIGCTIAFRTHEVREVAEHYEVIKNNPKPNEYILRWLKVRAFFEEYAFGKQALVLYTLVWGVLFGKIPGVGDCPFTGYSILQIGCYYLLFWAMCCRYNKGIKQNGRNRYKAMHMIYPDLFPERRRFGK